MPIRQTACLQSFLLPREIHSTWESKIKVLKGVLNAQADQGDSQETRGDA